MTFVTRAVPKRVTVKKCWIGPWRIETVQMWHLWLQSHMIRHAASGIKQRSHSMWNLRLGLSLKSRSTKKYHEQTCCISSWKKKAI